MKISFKKIVSIVGGIFLVGSTVAAAMMGALPSNFVQNTNSNVAMIYGANAAASDYTGATNLGDLIATSVIENTPPVETIDGEYDFSNAEGISEDIELGNSIITGKILNVLNDNRIPSLIDDKIKWDDGNSSDDSFNVHEELLIGDLKLKTSLDDNDFDEIALTNDKGFSYRYVFEEDMNINLIGDKDADTLYIKILGEKYEVDSFDDSSIVVVTSEEKAFKKGDSYTLNGKTVNIDGIGEDSIWMNGVIIDEGDTESVNGLKIYVDKIFFSGDESMVMTKIGEEITTEFETGEAYPGEDEDEPNWVWDINNPGKKDGWIGVTYDKKATSPDDDGIMYVGDSLILPKGYASLNFESTTEVNYDDFKVKFIEEKDLWNSTYRYSVKEDVPVIQIEGPNEDSFTVNGKETNTIYLRFAQADDGTEVNTIEGSVEIFYEDINKDVSDSVRPRYTKKLDLESAGTLSDSLVATIDADDTSIQLRIEIINGKARLDFVNDVNTLSLNIGGEENLLAHSGAFQWLGSNDKDAESNELIINGINIGTEDNDVMDHYGMIVETPENNGDDDEVVIQIPTDKVEAQISIVGEGSKVIDTNATMPTLPTGTDYVFKDTSVSSVKDKNLIVVGGTCINAVARTLLGTGTLCGEDFTEETGVSAGQALVQVFQNPYAEDKVAILVAGYNAEDTTAAINKIADGTIGIDLSTIGEKIII